jgi:hypothetical protein
MGMALAAADMEGEERRSSGSASNQPELGGEELVTGAGNPEYRRSCTEVSW